jgi:hypothetical protein
VADQVADRVTVGGASAAAVTASGCSVSGASKDSLTCKTLASTGEATQSGVIDLVAKTSLKYYSRQAPDNHTTSVVEIEPSAAASATGQVKRVKTRTTGQTVAFGGGNDTNTTLLEMEWYTPSGGGGGTVYWSEGFRTYRTTGGLLIPMGDYFDSDGVSVVDISNSGVLGKQYGTTFSKSTGTPKVILSAILPVGYVAGTLQLQLVTRTHPRAGYGETSNASGNVYVEAQSVCLSGSDNANTDGANSATNATITISGDHKIIVTTVTVPDTSCAAGEQIQVRVQRMRSDGSDTFANTWVLVNARLTAQAAP